MAVMFVTTESRDEALTLLFRTTLKFDDYPIKGVGSARFENLGELYRERAQLITKSALEVSVPQVPEPSDSRDGVLAHNLPEPTMGNS